MLLRPLPPGPHRVLPRRAPAARSLDLYEFWLAAPGLETRYEVSTFGRVRNLSTGYILAASGRYPSVTLAGRTIRVHVLMAEVFLGRRRRVNSCCTRTATGRTPGWATYGTERLARTPPTRGGTAPVGGAAITATGSRPTTPWFGPTACGCAVSALPTASAATLDPGGPGPREPSSRRTDWNTSARTGRCGGSAGADARNGPPEGHSKAAHLTQPTVVASSYLRRLPARRGSATYAVAERTTQRTATSGQPQDGGTETPSFNIPHSAPSRRPVTVCGTS